MGGVKPYVFWIAALVGCSHPAPLLEDGCAPARGDIVLTGSVPGGGALELKSASGRVYSVRAPESGFVVTLPAGVYDVHTIAGVSPGAPLSFNTIPGDRVDLGRFDVVNHTVTTSPTSSSALPGTRSACYFGGNVHETPLRYYSRTGSVARPLPVPANWGGGSRAGMGLGLRSR